MGLRAGPTQDEVMAVSLAKLGIRPRPVVDGLRDRRVSIAIEDG